jgi:hypothetical protein
MRKLVFFCVKALALLSLGAYAAASYMSPPKPPESPEQPSRAQIVIDLTKTDGHFNIGIGWRRVDEVKRQIDAERSLRKEQF